MCVAEDVHISIRGHDYFEAMRVLKEELASNVLVDRLSREDAGILLRPSVAVSAAVTQDSGALRSIGVVASRAEERHDGHGASLVKAPRTRATYTMAERVKSSVEDRGEISLPDLKALAHEQRHGAITTALRMLKAHGVPELHDGVAHRCYNQPERARETVPPFKAYFSTRDDMDSDQSEFFDSVFVPKFMNDEFVDLEGNVCP